MRPDMSKVIVERPRPGSSRRVKRRFKRFDVNHIDTGGVGDPEEWDDFLPSRIGHKRLLAIGRDRKYLNENLSPLRRYLASQVGRPWNKVWSDISANVRADNTVQQHVRDHIPDFVADRTFVRDGKIYFANRHGPPLPLIDDGRVRFHRNPEFYVDPRTGLLCRNRHRRSYRAEQRQAAAVHRKALAERMRIIDEHRQYHLLADGNWWEVVLSCWSADRRRVASGAAIEAMDVVLRAGLSVLSPSDLYDRHDVYAVSKRALSAKDMKAAGLRG